MADNKFHTGKILENIKKMKADVPVKLANMTQRFFLASFTEQGWGGDGGLNKWKEVKRRQPRTPEYKYPKTKQLSRRTSPILVRTGKLRRAVSNSIRLATFEKIQLVVPLEYAKYQNDGTTRITKRKFMGDGVALRKKQKALILNEMAKVWQG
jgi:hypothetical protein